MTPALERGMALVEHRYATSSARSHNAKLNKFARFCDEDGRDVSHVRALDVVAYLGWLFDEGRVSPKSLGGYISAINVLCRHRGHAAPGDDAIVREARIGYAKTWSVGDPIVRVPTPLALMSQILTCGLHAAQNRQWLLVRACVAQVFQFFVMGRPQLSAAFKRQWLRTVSEYEFLAVVPPQADGRKAKDREPHRVARFRPSHSRSCAHPLDLLTVWVRYRDRACPGEHLFAMSAHDPAPSAETQNKWLQQAAAAVGYVPAPGTQIRAHGTRAGAATAAFKSGAPVLVIKTLADWARGGMTFESVYYDPGYACDDNVSRVWFGDLIPGSWTCR